MRSDFLGMSSMRPVPCLADRIMRGTFVTFEGGEGAGKTTQIDKLCAFLSEHKIDYVKTREPGGTDAAEAIRELIVTGDAERWDAVSETLLIMTARYHHLQHRILPALQEGKWVICDRFLDSTKVYQGTAKGVDSAWIEQLYRLTCGNVEPDITFALDIDPAEGLKRTTVRDTKETRFESMDMSFHISVREGFLTLAHACPKRYVVINAAQDMEEIHKKICCMIEEHFLTGKDQ